VAYVYRHIRLDKNEPFYIGIGSDDKYYRANKKSQRNIYWKRIMSKTDYEVEIVLEDLTWEQACEKEKEFIVLYGRKDLKNGCLVNMTEGGDGTLGVIVSSETRKKLSNSIKEWNKTRVISEKQRQISSYLFKKLNKNEDFQKKRIESLRNSEKLKKYYISIKGKPSGYKHTEEMKLKLSLLKTGLKYTKERLDKVSKKVIQKTIDGEIIKIWDSAKQVQRETPFRQGNISNCCNGKYKQAYGFKWEYYKQ
jgi:hypothetical protein